MNKVLNLEDLVKTKINDNIISFEYYGIELLININDKYKFIAMDANGNIYKYAGEPYICSSDNSYWIEFNSGIKPELISNVLLYGIVPLADYIIGWEDSLLDLRKINLDI